MSDAQLELLIMRHGESGWAQGEEDFGRTLTEWGRRDTRRIGERLLSDGLLPERIVSSPAQRALSTTEQVCMGMAQPGRRFERDARIYEAGVKQLLAVLADCPADCGRLLLVGHNPGLERLLVQLVGGETVQTQRIGMSPGTLVRLALTGPWSQLSGDAKLLSVMRPRPD